MAFALDPLLLSRVQFGFTISFHIIFPALSIGLAAYLMVLEFLWLKTRNRHYKDLYLFWMKIFAVCFGIGVVSGITMPFQFGTNWAPFTAKIANVIGPLMGFEVLTAFFLESSFLGIMLFGWNKVSEKMHFFATCAVSIGTAISAFWILSANSWMQTPQGYSIGKDGIFYPENWLEIIFNPSFGYRFVHMMMAAFLATACIVGGVGAIYLKQKRYLPQARTMFAMAMLMMIVVAPLQILAGDLHGLNTLHHQPLKIAAIEGHWKTEKEVPLFLLAQIDEKNETTKGLSIPKGASLMLGHSTTAEIKGIQDWPKQDRPPVTIIFWTFRIMVGMGLLMVGMGALACFIFTRGTLFTSRFLHTIAILAMPAGLIAILMGWYTTEIGRQPFTVYNVMRTANSLSPVTGEAVAFSMLLYVISYLIVFGAGMYYIVKLIRKGPKIGDDQEVFGSTVEEEGNVWAAAFPSFFTGKAKASKKHKKPSKKAPKKNKGEK